MKLRVQNFINFFFKWTRFMPSHLDPYLYVVFPIFLNDSWSSCCLAPLHCFLCVGIWSNKAQISKFCYSLTSYSSEQGSQHTPSHLNPCLLCCFHGSSLWFLVIVFSYSLLSYHVQKLGIYKAMKKCSLNTWYN